jgi:hypothetical protein
MTLHSPARSILAGAVLALALAGTLSAPAAAQPLPSWTELEAAGARIGTIRISPQTVFDTSDPEEDKLLFHWANRLHIRTRPGVIERALLFRSDEPLSVRLLDETERLLRSERYLYDVEFRAARLGTTAWSTWRW